MKKIITIITLSLFSIGLFAQGKIGKVSGTITDAAQKPLEAATVQLLRAENKALVKAAVTNKQGVFEIEKIAAGKYLLSVSAVAFISKNTEPFELNVEKNTVQMPAIQLAASSKELSGVTVTGRKPLIEQKIDRTVINVDAAPTNAGSTAMEVLEKSPGISVDNDGNISLKGKQGVIVMLDGKPTYLSAADLANVLKNMPASALDQIEIMTNPPAKYDASGNSGIINIKTKKNRNDGLNGSITAGGTIGLYKRNDSYLAPLKQTTSVNLNYRKGKLNLFGNYNFNYREGKADLLIDRKFFNKDGSLNSYSNSATEMNMRNNNHTLKIGIDYYADKKNVFGVVLNGFGFFGKPAPFSTQTIYLPDGTVQSILKSYTTNKLTFWNYSGNFNYKHTFDTLGTELTADLDYIGYSNGSKSLLVTDVYDGTTGGKTGNLTLKGNIPSIINIYSAKADFTHPLKKDMRFDAGFKVSYVKSNNEVEYERDNGNGWVPDDRSNHFIYEENINAAYVSINKKWKKWSTQAGLRLENTTSKGKQVLNDSSFTRKYTSLFPTFYLNYEVNKNNTLTLSYGRRIERPNYQDLNPFLWFLDSLTFRQGNPYLLPQYSNNLELRHSYKGGLTTSISYAITDDVISQILKQNTEKRITFLTTDNVARFRNMGFSVNAPFKPAKWWSVNAFANVFNNKYTGFYYNSYTGNNDPLNISYTSFMVNVSNTFTFKKGWTAEISGFYRGKGVEQLSISDPMYFMSLGGQKTVLKGKGTVRLNIRDPFHWQVYSGKTNYSDIDLKIYNKWDNRSATVTFSYRFGKSNVPQARRRKSGADDEQSRAGGQQN
ncbi:MAG: outer membrane beta-barrel family protein [Chitinophagaceae bacterium]